MPELPRTGFFALAAVVAVGAAVLARPAAPSRTAFDDAGERFFDEFDPLSVTALEIVAYDETTAQRQAFKVLNRDGVWTIPSHDDYPADSNNQLANAAGTVVDLVKGPKVSDAAADHALYGVLEPAAGGSAAAGAGTRITMQNAAGTTLVDLIVGKSVKDSAGLRYVRTPGRDRVYTCALDTNALSTRFEDWIERDLLGLEPAQITGVTIADYEVDEVNRRIIEGDTVRMLKTPANEWTLDQLADGEALDTATASALRTALDDLEIIDVVRKPAGLGEALRAEGELRLDTDAMLSLQDHGFYIAGGRVVSNQGDTIVTMANGVVYVLRFGQIALGTPTGDLLDDENAADEAPDGASRYLFITVEFDRNAVAPPVKAPLPPLAADDADEATRTAAQAEHDRVKSANEAAHAAWEAKLTEGEQRVRELNARFADWYYVIANDVYEKIRLTRADLVTDAIAPDEMTAPGIPGLTP